MEFFLIELVLKLLLIFIRLLVDFGCEIWLVEILFFVFLLGDMVFLDEWFVFDKYLFVSLLLFKFKFEIGINRGLEFFFVL